MLTRRQVTELPKFPENRLGLRRGTVLESTHPNTEQINVTLGKRIIIGYDGEYVCCGPYNWSIEQIVNEIETGMWKIVEGEDIVDLTDPEESAEFALMVENLELITTPTKLDS